MGDLHSTPCRHNFRSELLTPGVNWHRLSRVCSVMFAKVTFHILCVFLYFSACETGWEYMFFLFRSHFSERVCRCWMGRRLINISWGFKGSEFTNQYFRIYDHRQLYCFVNVWKCSSHFELLSYILIVYSPLYSSWVSLQRWKLRGSFSSL